MYHTKKIFFTIIIAIVCFINRDIFAHSHEHGHDHCENSTPTNQQTPNNTTIALTIQNPESHHEKRSMRMRKILWSHIKSIVGISALGSGTVMTTVGALGALLPSVLEKIPAANVLIIVKKGTIRYFAAAEGLAGLLLTYIGYKFVQNAHNTYRDEIIESARLS